MFSGFTPLGTAVQGTHAEVLGQRTGIEARTVASLLMAVAKGTVSIAAFVTRAGAAHVRRRATGGDEDKTNEGR